MRSLLRQAVARIRGFLRPADGVEDFDEELASHLEMAVEDKVRQGLSPGEARRQARVELGNLTQLRDAARDARGLPWLGASWLDVKLGVRRLRRTWGLTLVAGLAMTVVIGIGAVAFDVLATFGDTDLPLDEGERVVALQDWNAERGVASGVSVRDLEHWRAALRSVADLGAFRTVERNLTTLGAVDADRPAETLEVAEMSASGFALARVAPILGRPLLAEDELASSEPVLVVGQEVWESRFGADPGALGRQVRLDGRVHTLVGVMPEGFGFPLFHRYWVPLKKTDPRASNDGDLVVFARLEPGVTLGSAGHELRRVGLAEGGREAGAGEAGKPRTSQLRVVPYAAAFTGDVDSGLVPLALLFAALLLVPPCINIAVLVYARTVARQGELAARYFLGASRFHIVAQLFVEILVLALASGAVALGLARVVVWQVVGDLEGRGQSIPFWMDFALSPRTVVFVALLAILAALIAGVVPALQATGRRLQSGLRSLSGQTAPRLGGAWTALIVLQVAFSFALLPSSVELTWGTLRAGLLGPGFAAEEYLTVSLEMADPEGGGAVEGSSAQAMRFLDRQQELVRLLTAESGVVSVSVSSAVPGEEPWLGVESESSEESAEGIASEASTGGGTLGSDRLTRVNHVDPGFFESFELPMLTGRGFAPGDFEVGRRAVIVNQSFVVDVLAGADPLGRRIRYRTLDEESVGFETHPERWFEIVGVVADLQRNASVQTVYHPTAPGSLTSVSLALRTRGDPAAAADVLRQRTWALDPALRLTQIRWLDAIYRQKSVGDFLGASGLVAATLSVLLLSAAGIYALMLFTVNRRRKEIGIRRALGAQTPRLLSGIFGRALAKVGFGAMIGVGIAWLIGQTIPIAALGGREVAGILPAATLFIAAVAGLALLGPARRALRVEPIDELREG